MKKILLIATIIATASFSVLAQTDDDKTKEAKKEYVSNCMAQVPPESGVDQTLVKEFCECSSDRMFEKYSLEELAKFETDQSEETQTKMMEVLQPCLEDFMSKMQGGAE